jgi:hypothetical protein
MPKESEIFDIETLAKKRQQPTLGTAESSIPSSTAAGGPNRHPWPSISSVIDCGHWLKKLLEDGEKCLVTEKLDGSNLCVHSNGVVASRRQVLLSDPGKLAKTKFNGLTLEPLEQTLKSAARLEKMFAEKVFPCLDPVVIVYGEVIQRGTASSKEDKFKYGERGFEPGHLYAFGLGLYFQEAAMDMGEMERARMAMEEQGFCTRCKECDENDPYLICILNEKLSELFFEHGLRTVSYDAMPLEDVFELYESALLAEDLTEGIVITCARTQTVFKWKGLEESFSPERVQHFHGLDEELAEWPRVLRPLAAVGNVVLEQQERLAKSKRLVKELEVAFTSAKSKFPAYEDLVKEGDGGGDRKSALDEHVRDICKEMQADAVGREDFLTEITTFARKKYAKIYQRLDK